MASEGPKRRAKQLRHIRGRPAWSRLLEVARSRRSAWGALIVVAFAIGAIAITLWGRSEPPRAVGRVANRTHVVRAPFEVVDAAATRSARDQARRRTPRVYQAEESVLAGIRSSLLNLPLAVADAESLEDVGEEVRARFDLDQRRLGALRSIPTVGGGGREWRRNVERLIEGLHEHPMLDGPTWTNENLHGVRGEKWIELRNQGVRRVRDTAAINIDADVERLGEAAAALAREAGFRGPLVDVVVSRLTNEPEATYRFDPEATERARAEAAARVEPIKREVAVGTTIVRRGEVIETSHAEMIEAERNAHRRALPPWRFWLHRAGIASGALIVTGAGAGYVVLFCPRIRSSTARAAWIAALLFAAIGVAVLATSAQPRLIAATSVAPILFVAIIAAIAYDPRTSLALSALAGLLVALALDQSAARFALLIGALGAAIVSLRDVRDRNTLIRTGLLVAGVLGLGTAIATIIEGPVNPALVRQGGIDALLAAVAGLVVGGLTMFVLPTIERVFDITTGMTLIELRDPKQPLLRELQQRAPGTYNHSLNVASIAEAAADAIGADALLTYVGALYHDIGKMNKPEYFVENQAGGPNKHDKLRPAMSLLVIVGHVKDGVELAREAELPRQIIQFIEGHHGTTLVEYFYRRAQQAAQEKAAERLRDEGGAVQVERPEEFEYRYPGPKPQTREVAILMLADAVESATRTLPEPTPSRIDALVRDLANKRLLDGQFDECNLTLSELNTIVESISKTVSSIYHGRFVYPSEPAGAVPPQRRAGGEAPS